MFSMCSELTPRAPIPDSRIAQFMQPWLSFDIVRLKRTSIEFRLLTRVKSLKRESIEFGLNRSKVN